MDLKLCNPVLTATLQSHSLRCYSQLMAEAAQQLQQRPAAVSLEAAAALLVEVSLMVDVFNTIAPVNDARDSVLLRRALSHELAASQVMEHWARLLLLLAGSGRLQGQERAEAQVALAQHHMAKGLLAGRGISACISRELAAGGSPCLQHLLAAQVTQLCAALDGGASYGLPAGAPPLTSSDGEPMRHARQAYGVFAAQCACSLWSAAVRDARECRAVAMWVGLAGIAEGGAEAPAAAADLAGDLLRCTSPKAGVRKLAELAAAAAAAAAASPADASRQAALQAALAAGERAARRMAVVPLGRRVTYSLAMRLARGAMAAAAAGGAAQQQQPGLRQQQQRAARLEPSHAMHVSLAALKCAREVLESGLARMAARLAARAAAPSDSAPQPSGSESGERREGPAVDGLGLAPCGPSPASRRQRQEGPWALRLRLLEWWRAAAWWLDLAMRHGGPDDVRSGAAMLRLYTLDVTGLPRAPCPDVAAAMAAGAVRLQERLLRWNAQRAGTVLGWGATCLLCIADAHGGAGAGPSWPQLLAHGDPAEAASLAATAAKLLRRAAREFRALMGPGQGPVDVGAFQLMQLARQVAKLACPGAVRSLLEPAAATRAGPHTRACRGAGPSAGGGGGPISTGRSGRPEGGGGGAPSGSGGAGGGPRDQGQEQRVVDLTSGGAASSGTGPAPGAQRLRLLLPSCVAKQLLPALSAVYLAMLDGPMAAASSLFFEPRSCYRLEALNTLLPWVPWLAASPPWRALLLREVRVMALLAAAAQDLGPASGDELPSLDEQSGAVLASSFCSALAAVAQHLAGDLAAELRSAGAAAPGAAAGDSEAGARRAGPVSSSGLPRLSMQTLRGLLGGPGPCRNPRLLRDVMLLAGKAPACDTGGSGLGSAPGCAAAAAALAPPSEAAALLPLCSNPACDNLAGDSEAGLQLQGCGRCGGRARYCSRACQVAHWKAGHREECQAAGGAMLETLTPAAKAAIVAQIGVMLLDRGRDDLVELGELQRALAARGVSLSLAAVEGYVAWMSLHHDQELAKGNFFPDIAYDEDSKMFSLM